MRKIAIIGAGIAGASTAYWLRRAGLEVRLFEASDRIGGCMGSHRRDGFTVERGPHLFVDSDGALTKLAADLDIAHELVEPSAIAGRRFVLRDGELQLIPRSPGALLSTGVLSVGGKVRAAAEPLIPARDQPDESVADFVRRRFGGEVLDYLVDPFISATQLGDPETLSTRFVMSGLGELERRHGSVVVGGIRGQDKSEGRRGSVAFARGSWVLLEALKRELGDSLELNAPVELVRQTASGFEVSWRAHSETRCDSFDEVILAVPAWALGEIEFDVAGVPPAGFGAAGETPYAPAVMVSLGFEAHDVDHPLDGFGVLIPSCEERRMLATIFTSSIFPSRSPEGSVLLTSIMGGVRRPTDTALTDEVLVRRTARELLEVLGIDAEPIFSHVERQPRALAQCDEEHHLRMTAFDAAHRQVEGLSVISNFRGKSAVPWMVSQAARTSDRLAQRVT